MGRRRCEQRNSASGQGCGASPRALNRHWSQPVSAEKTSIAKSVSLLPTPPNMSSARLRPSRLKFQTTEGSTNDLELHRKLVVRCLAKALTLCAPRAS